MNDTLVSIITPSFNQGQFIQHTIESVLNQSYKNIEYLVLDGGSTDNTLDLLRSYGDRIHWISEPDRGQSDAINKGFCQAKGEIVAWLNSDDTYELNAIELVVEYFKQYPDVALVYGEGFIIDKLGTKVRKFEPTKEFDLWMLIHQWDYILQPATFFRKEPLKVIGYLDPNKHWTMDWDLWIRFALKYELKYLPAYLANSREYEDTKTETGGFKRFSEIARIMRFYGELDFPPGYFSYLGSTIATQCKDIFGLNILSRKIATFLHIWFNRKLTGLYSDGWMSKYLFLAIPTKYRQVKITLVPLGLKKAPRTVWIKKNQKLVDRKQVNLITPTEIILNIENNEKSIDFFTIKAERVVDMSKLSGSADKRKLSYRILSIEKIT